MAKPLDAGSFSWGRRCERNEQFVRGGAVDGSWAPPRIRQRQPHDNSKTRRPSPDSLTNQAIYGTYQPIGTNKRLAPDVGAC